jgi:hypothetical protein
VSDRGSHNWDNDDMRDFANSWEVGLRYVRARGPGFIMTWLTSARELEEVSEIRYCMQTL